MKAVDNFARNIIEIYEVFSLLVDSDNYLGF